MHGETYIFIKFRKFWSRKSALNSVLLTGKGHQDLGHFLEVAILTNRENPRGVVAAIVVGKNPFWSLTVTFTDKGHGMKLCNQVLSMIIETWRPWREMKHTVVPSYVYHPLKTFTFFQATSVHGRFVTLFHHFCHFEGWYTLSNTGKQLKK